MILKIFWVGLCPALSEEFQGWEQEARECEVGGGVQGLQFGYSARAAGNSKESATGSKPPSGFL